MPVNEVSSSLPPVFSVSETRGTVGPNRRGVPIFLISSISHFRLPDKPLNRYEPHDSGSDQVRGPRNRMRCTRLTGRIEQRLNIYYRDKCSRGIHDDAVGFRPGPHLVVSQELSRGEDIGLRDVASVGDGVRCGDQLAKIFRDVGE